MTRVDCDEVVCDNSDHGKGAKVIGEVVERLVANHGAKPSTCVSWCVLVEVEVCTVPLGFWFVGSEEAGVVCVLFGQHGKPRTRSNHIISFSFRFIAHHAPDYSSFQWNART